MSGRSGQQNKEKLEEQQRLTEEFQAKRQKALDLQEQGAGKLRVRAAQFNALVFAYRAYRKEECLREMMQEILEIGEPALSEEEEAYVGLVLKEELSGLAQERRLAEERRAVQKEKYRREREEEKKTFPERVRERIAEDAEESRAIRRADAEARRAEKEAYRLEQEKKEAAEKAARTRTEQILAKEREQVEAEAAREQAYVKDRIEQEIIRIDQERLIAEQKRKTRKKELQKEKAQEDKRLREKRARDEEAALLMDAQEREQAREQAEKEAQMMREAEAENARALAIRKEKEEKEAQRLAEKKAKDDALILAALEREIERIAGERAADAEKIRAQEEAKQRCKEAEEKRRREDAAEEKERRAREREEAKRHPIENELLKDVYVQASLSEEIARIERERSFAAEKRKEQEERRREAEEAERERRVLEAEQEKQREREQLRLQEEAENRAAREAAEKERIERETSNRLAELRRVKEEEKARRIAEKEAGEKEYIQASLAKDLVRIEEERTSKRERIKAQEERQNARRQEEERLRRKQRKEELAALRREEAEEKKIREEARRKEQETFAEEERLEQVRREKEKARRRALAEEKAREDAYVQAMLEEELARIERERISAGENRKSQKINRQIEDEKLREKEKASRLAVLAQEKQEYETERKLRAEEKAREEAERRKQREEVLARKAALEEEQRRLREEIERKKREAREEQERILAAEREKEEAAARAIAEAEAIQEAYIAEGIARDLARIEQERLSAFEKRKIQKANRKAEEKKLREEEIAKRLATDKREKEAYEAERKAREEEKAAAEAERQRLRAEERARREAEEAERQRLRTEELARKEAECQERLAEKRARKAARIERRASIRKRKYRQSWFAYGADAVLAAVYGILIGLQVLYNSTMFRDLSSTLREAFFANETIIIKNVLPAVYLILALYLLTGRLWAAVLTGSAILYAMSWGNYFKLLYRDDPFVAGDLTVLREAQNISGLYDITLTDWMIKELWVVIGVVVLTLLVQIARRIYRKKREKKPIAPLRWLAYVCRAVLLGVVILVTATGWTSFADKEDYIETQLSGQLDGMEYWRQTDQYVSHGFLYPFIYSIKDTVEMAPNGYSETAAKEILSRYESADIPEDTKIDVISIMLEAYTDLSDWEQIPFNIPSTEIYHEWNRLKEEGISGRYLTNIFAAGTVDTERAYLTGFLTDNIGYYGQTSSYVQYLRSQGYRTTGGHPGNNWFYNRTNINEFLGFDSYYFREDRYNNLSKDVIIHDNDFLPDIIRQYDEADHSKPYFGFYVTYQNHGPYEAVRVFADDYISPATFEDDAEGESYFHILNNYLGGIKWTNDSLANFTDQLRAEERPIVLVLFGDHNPWLGDNNSVYEALGVNINLGTQEGFENYYETDYVIWANPAARALLEEKGTWPESGDGGLSSPGFLMTKVFDVLGWKGPAYTQLLRDFRDEIAGNYSFTERLILNDGTFMTDGVTGETARRLQEIYIAQYYLRHHQIYGKE